MRIVLVDDDKMICFALKTIIETDENMKVVAIGHNFEDAVRLFHETLPDVCLFDIQIGEKTGIDALKEIKKENPNAKIIFLTTFLDKDYIQSALLLGSSGYILKDDFENIIPAIHSVYVGQTVFGSEVLNTLPLSSSKEEATSSENLMREFLSEREIEVLALISDGLNNKEISTRLFLSEGTVRNYISSMLDKLGLRDRTQLAIWYLNKKTRS